jgi:hypothetical protein
MMVTHASIGHITVAVHAALYRRAADLPGSSVKKTPLSTNKDEFTKSISRMVNVFTSSFTMPSIGSTS